MIKSTTQHQEYWKNRVIDWKTSYFDTFDHPHRKLIIDVLKDKSFGSLLEIGCASGPNLFAIQRAFPRAQLGGIDINPGAIATAKALLAPHTVLDVGGADDLFFSDKSSDVILTDMALIYLGPTAMKKALKEVKRVGRKHAIFVEFHSSNPLKRLGLRLASGYNSYNYKTLLEKNGFYDIEIRKITESEWPGGEPQKQFAYIITCNI